MTKYIVCSIIGIVVGLVVSIGLNLHIGFLFLAVILGGWIGIGLPNTLIDVVNYYDWWVETLFEPGTGCLIVLIGSVICIGSTPVALGIIICFVSPIKTIANRFEKYSIRSRKYRPVSRPLSDEYLRSTEAYKQMSDLTRDMFK